MQDKVGILQLCSSCTFLIVNVTINNENQAGTGGGITIFTGQPGSRVDLMGGYILMKACPPARPHLALINMTQRSMLFPNPLGQSVDLVNVTYRVSHAVCMHHA
jgi:hypothetical protein